MALPGSSHEKHPGAGAPSRGSDSSRKELDQCLGKFSAAGSTPYPVTTGFANTISAGGEKGAGEENVYKNPSFGTEEQKAVYIHTVTKTDASRRPTE